MSYSYDEFGELLEENCAENFEDVEFWSAMREEQYWMDHPEHREFYDFWEEFHFSTECRGDGDWYDFECSDFGDDSGCRIEVHWNDCDASQFECSIRRDDDNGNAEDCAMNFKDTEYWNTM
jgi:hypothetical protein